jgi:hypothetical protein
MRAPRAPPRDRHRRVARARMAAAAGGDASSAEWTLVPLSSHGAEQLQRGDKRLPVPLSADAPTVVGRSQLTRVRAAQRRSGAALARAASG